MRLSDLIMIIFSWMSRQISRNGALKSLLGAISQTYMHPGVYKISRSAQIPLQLSVELSVSVIYSVTNSDLEKNTLSPEKKENGEEGNDVIEFETLEEEEKKEAPNKITQLRAYLKENLDADKYSESLKILGIDEAMTNEQLLAAILEGIQTLMKPEEEEEKKKPEEEKEQEHADPDQKGFMEKCMKEGKSMADCAAEFKEKYPETPEKKEEEKPLEEAKKKDDDEEEKKHLELSPETQKEFDELKLEINRLKDERRLNDITHKVEAQIAEKHLAPVQKEGVIKLMASMDDEMHDELLGTFSNVKFKGFEDVAHATSERPGDPETLSEDDRKRILKEQGIDELILERGVRRPN